MGAEERRSDRCLRFYMPHLSSESRAALEYRFSLFVLVLLERLTKEMPFTPFSDLPRRFFQTPQRSESQALYRYRSLAPGT